MQICEFRCLRQRHAGVVGDVDAGDDEHELVGGHSRNLHDRMTLQVEAWTLFSGLRPTCNIEKKLCLFLKQITGAFWTPSLNLRCKQGKIADAIKTVDRNSKKPPLRLETALMSSRM